MRVALTIALALLVAEVAAFLALPSGLGPSSPDTGSPLLEISVPASRLRLRLDPFAGFMQVPGEGTNNEGFYERHDFPYERQEDEHVVGIFGGSVALSLCAPLRQQLAPSRVLCFAQIAHRMPQPFAIFARWADTVDEAIFVLGLNEVVFWGDDYPVDYPLQALWQPLAASQHHPDELVLLSRIRASQERQERVTDLFKGIPGNLSRALWLGAITREARARAEATADLSHVYAASSGYERGSEDRYFALIERVMRASWSMGPEVTWVLQPAPLDAKTALGDAARENYVALWQIWARTGELDLSDDEVEFADDFGHLSPDSRHAFAASIAQAMEER